MLTARKTVSGSQVCREEASQRKSFDDAGWSRTNADEMPEGRELGQAADGRDELLRPEAHFGDEAVVAVPFDGREFAGKCDRESEEDD